MLRLSLLCGLFTVLCGCASPWPDLPPEEYTGTVVNGPLNRAEAGATVSASRSALRGVAVFPVVDEIIGSTITRADGTFRLRTRTGYASDLTASSADRRLSARVRVRSHRNSINLRLEPGLSSISYREVDPLSDTAKLAAVAVRSIMYDISRRPTRPPQSLHGYARRGVISDEQFLLFKGIWVMRRG